MRSPYQLQSTIDRQFMKKLLYIICCILSAKCCAQQKVNTLLVVDAATGSAIPYVSVSIPKAKLAINTEADGVFSIPGNLAAMRDTIAFYAQNYISLKLPLHQLATMSDIKLAKAKFKPLKKSNYSATQVLNDYIADDVGLYAGVAADDAPFNYLQIAQQFVTDNQVGRLTSITISKTSDPLPTKFRIRIYDTDPVTGGPGADLCDQILDQDNKDYVNALLSRSFDKPYLPKKELSLDLKNYNIIIPNKQFFVAVEWLRDVSNAVNVPVYNKVTNKVDTAIVFRPYLGISDVTGPKLNIWVMQLDHTWKTYDHFMPFGTDMAIKATVEY